MRVLSVLLFLIIAIFAQPNEGYRILCLFPHHGRSHHVMFNAICKGLARRGHRIDMISHFPTKERLANYTDLIDLSGTLEKVVSSFTVDFAKSFDNGITYKVATYFGSTLCELLGQERFQKFIKNPPNDPPYDLVITEYFAAPCYIAFGHLLKAPVAVATSFLDMPYLDHFMGSPFNFAHFPLTHTRKSVVETFFDRLENFVWNYGNMHAFYYYTSDQTEIARKYLGQDVPDVRQLENSVALALVNTHHSVHGRRILAPSVVEVGGLHIKEDSKKISPEMKAWLDSAKDGVVYFTFGSLVKIETLPLPTIQIFYKSFAKIAPIKVLMKCTDSSKLPPGLPQNVNISAWMPQLAILEHKNTRAYMTHGGLMGVHETIYYGVPTIGIPVYADQERNVKLMVSRNVGVHLPMDKISEESLDAALTAVLHDPKYREAAKRVSKIFRDRPMDPLDTAIYYVEYVIRNGPNSLRTRAADLPWWKLQLIDVFAFLAVCFVLGAYLSYLLLKLLLRMLKEYIKIPGNKLKRN